ASSGGCDTRNVILNRDMSDVTHNDSCQVLSGVLNDSYTGKSIVFTRGATSSQAVQIDHVVALSNAWQTGAQQLSADRRIELANDPLELLAVDGPANQQKSDGDAATWLPSHKPFRCQYVARQIAVKAKYQLWITPAEKDAIARVLIACPGQSLPIR
ncbi:MAG: HNH endonuclease family protein, partial [Candidatus Saccharimonadales bacterium]